MSKIYGFKYEFKYNFSSDNVNILIILEVHKNKYYLKCYDFGDVYCVDITDQIDEFCNKLKNIKIEKWNNRYFSFWCHCVPETCWSLSIDMSDTNVRCSGMSAYPQNWDKFKEIMNSIGVKI